MTNNDTSLIEVAEGTEVIATVKGRNSINIFIPKPNEKHLGGLRSTKDPNKTFLRVVSSNPARSAGNWDTDYGQVICFGELGFQLAQHLNAAANGNNITIVAHYNLQLQKVAGRGKHEGRTFYNSVYQVYGYAIDDTFYTTRDGVVVTSEYVDKRPVTAPPVDRNLGWFTTVPTLSAEDALAGKKLSEMTPEEEAQWAADALPDMPEAPSQQAAATKPNTRAPRRNTATS